MMQRTPRPTVSPLDSEHELTAKRIVREALIAAVEDVTSWSSAERRAADVLDNLRAEGLELVTVRWPS